MRGGVGREGRDVVGEVGDRVGMRWGEERRKVKIVGSR